MGRRTRGRGLARGETARVGCSLGWAALAGCSVVFTPQAHAQDARKLEQELRDLEIATQQLVAEPLRGQELRSATFVEERLTDGELFYRLKDYPRASIILTDIVDNYPQHRAYPDALYLLGESLYAAKDYLGARTRLRQLISRADEPAFRPYAAKSLGRLIEIAIHTRDFDGVEGYFVALQKLPPAEVESATSYYRAKYLYNKAVPTDDVTRGGTELKTQALQASGLDEARKAFELVQQNSPFYPQARYFVGTILVLQRQFPQAIEAFRGVLRTPATTPEHVEVAELTQLALGRLYYETDQLDQAIEQYQAVPRTSKYFDTALFEVAWVYIRMGDSTRAERALEVLSIASPESRHIADGSILRGNLLLRNGQLDDAAKVFADASAKFGPTRDKLDKVIVEHQDTQAYFKEVVRTNIETFDASSIFPAEAVPFASEEADMERALSTLSDLAQARDLVRETSELMRRLDDGISGNNVVSVFADTRRMRQRTTAAHNRAASLRSDLADIEDRNAPAGGELANVREQRKQLEGAVRDMPEREEDFSKRDDELLGGYKGLTKDISELDVELLGMEARIVATERFLADTQDARMNPQGVLAMQTELTGQRGAVGDYQTQIKELKFQLEAARLQVGVGDARYQHDDEVRGRYNALIDREHQLAGANNPQYDGLMRRIATVDSSVAARDQQIDAVVAERVAGMRQVLASEGTNVEGYRQRLGELEAQAEDVIGGVTAANFNAVRSRFYDLVLRADVGNIDVSWADREEHRQRVELLTRQRASETKALDDEFQEIMDEPKGGAQ
ncbi:MAG TPA: tetratricopeptide repeat protein [Polyangiales bacterium]|nr:tetratricopeptide repeat protein [Polyangiales bacterium]